MDPKANLKEQIALAKELNEIWDDCNGDGTLSNARAQYAAQQAGRLAELVIALDEWQRKGGFSPYV